MTPPPTATVTSPATERQSTAKPMTDGRRGTFEHVMLYVFVILPFLALIAAIPVLWGWGLTWRDVILFFAFYIFTGLGVTMGFHRHFTHGSFKAKRGLKVLLAIAGSMSVQGPMIRWVADHRRHHAYSDREGDPHSPWRYGENTRALAKGLWHAHTGWLFDREKSNKHRFAPDLLKDRDVVLAHKLFPVLMLVTTFLPGIIGGLWSMSWSGALTGLFWGGLVRISVLHHVTWSVNSICHAIGERPFVARDKSTNFWPLAIPSFGESWHNSHHADPTAARHGLLKGQLDSTARMIRWAEKLGWAYDVRWPSPERIQSKLAKPETT